MFIRSKVFAVLALALHRDLAFTYGILHLMTCKTKSKLQEALSTFLDGRSTDGHESALLDQDDKKLKAVYLSSNNHPMIVPLNNGNYFLCADGYDEERQSGSDGLPCLSQR